MNRVFAWLGDILANLIFTEEFPRLFGTLVTKWIFVMYCCIGGFCFDDRVRKWFRKFWLAYNAFGFVFEGACIFGYLSSRSNDTYIQEIFIITPCVAGLLSIIFVYASTFQMRRTFGAMFKLMKNKVSVRVGSDEVSEVERIDNRKLLRMSAYGIILLLASTSIYRHGSYVETGNSVSKNGDKYMIYYYPIYYPYEHTWSAEFAIGLVQLLTLLPIIIMACCTALLYYILTAEVHNKFVDIKLTFEASCNRCYQRLDEIEKSKMVMVESRIPHKNEYPYTMLSRERKMALAEVRNEMIETFKHLQKWYPIMKAFTIQISSLFSKLYLSVLFTGTIFGYCVANSLLRGDWHNWYQVWPCFVAFLWTSCGWLIVCYIGDMIANMNEIIAEQLYNSPWYTMEPRDRKMVLNFLTIVQRPLRVHVIKALPISLSMFPATMNSIYSYSQLLWTVQTSKSKR